MAIGLGCSAAAVAAPHQHRHVERLGITRQTLADLAVAPNTQQLAGQRLAQIDLPLALAEGIDGRHQLPAGIED
ncbi:hypothetical protein D3C85_1618830 [compost metagenome]